MSEGTVGEFVDRLEALAPAWVPFGSGQARYTATIDVDPDTGEWSVVKHVP